MAPDMKTARQCIGEEGGIRKNLKGFYGRGCNLHVQLPGKRTYSDDYFFLNLLKFSACSKISLYTSSLSTGG
jgi:hypothetical protein